MPLQLHYLCTSPSKRVYLLSYQAGNISQTRKTFLSPCQVTLCSSHTATTFLFAPEGPDMQTTPTCSSCLVENRLILHEKAKNQNRWSSTMSQTHQTARAYCPLDESQVRRGNNRLTTPLIYTFPAEASCP